MGEPTERQTSGRGQLTRSSGDRERDLVAPGGTSAPSGRRAVKKTGQPRQRSAGLLAKASRLLLRRGPDVVAPPGSEAGLALLLALAGILVGLAMPTQIAMIRLGRVMVSDGAGAFFSALQAIPRPGFGLAAVAAALVVGTVGLSGGWINATLFAVRGEVVSERAWPDGVRRAARVFSWNLVLVCWLGLVGLIGGEFGYLAITSGLTASHGGDLLMPSLMGIGGLALWAFTLGAAVYYLAISCLGAIVAVAEPGTGFWTLFLRAPRLFVAAAGWRGIRELVGLLAGWWTIKALCTQLMVPFGPVSVGEQGIAYGVAGALLQAGLTLGDGLVLLLAIAMGAIAYQEASSRLELAASEADGELRQGKLKPWPPLPGPRSGS